MSDHRFDFRSFRSLNLVMMFGTTVVANLLVVGAIGYLIVKWFNLETAWLIPFLMFGVFSGIFNGIRQLLREAEKIERVDEDSKKRSSGDDRHTDNRGSDSGDDRG